MRKMKKFAIGKRIGKTKLKILLRSVTVTENKYPEPDTITPYPFCPECGCEAAYSVNHGVDYPEVWIEYFCTRCHNRVAAVDNGPYVHILSEMAESKL